MLTIFFSSSASFWSSFNSLNLKGHSCAHNKATHGWLCRAALVNLNVCPDSYTLLHSPFFLISRWRSIETKTDDASREDRAQLWQVAACLCYLELRHASTEHPSSRQSKIAVMQPSSHSKTGGGGGGACQFTVNPCHCHVLSPLCYRFFPHHPNVADSPLVMASSTFSWQSSPQI